MKGWARDQSLTKASISFVSLSTSPNHQCPLLKTCSPAKCSPEAAAGGGGSGRRRRWKEKDEGGSSLLPGPGDPDPAHPPPTAHQPTGSPADLRPIGIVPCRNRGLKNLTYPILVTTIICQNDMSFQFIIISFDSFSC